MATGTAGSMARAHPLQMVHYLRKGINFNDTGIATDATVEVGILPAGAIVLCTMLKVTTAFNAGTNNPIDVGTSSNDDALVDGGTTGAGDADIDATTAGAYIVWRGAGETFASDTTIYVTYTESGTAATAGVAEVVVLYIPDGDR